MKRFILFLAVFAYLFTPFVLAQEASSTPVNEPTGSAAISDDTSSEKDSDYPLPYPGILPDNPFYTIKVLRDNVVGILISNPVKKAEFSLLQANKRLQAGVFLIQKSKKYDLAQQTISKGENYFEEAINKTREAKRQGQDTGSIQSQLKMAVVKHKDIISDLTENAPKDMKKSFGTLLQRITQLEKEVKSTTK